MTRSASCASPGPASSPDGSTVINAHPADGDAATLWRIDRIEVGASAVLYRAYTNAGAPEPYISTPVHSIDRVPFPATPLTAAQQAAADAAVAARSARVEQFLDDPYPLGVGPDIADDDVMRDARR